MTIVVPGSLVTPVDRAIALEERAEELLDAGQLDPARVALLASLPLIDQSFGAAVQRLAESHGKDLDAAHVLVTLVKVKAKKVKAIALMKPQTAALASQALRQALVLELELAAWAELKGLPL